MSAKATDLVTRDGLRVYDLDPLAGDLWAVAGPDGYDPSAIDPDALPEGFRWLDGDEWSGLVNPPARAMTEEQKYQWAVAQQGYEGSYQDWRAMSAAERAEYEAGASGEGN